MRGRAHEMLDLALDGRVDGWRVDLGRLPETARFVAAVIRGQYPDLKVPFHARWRHFVFAGRDLWTEMGSRIADPDARARAAFDLAIVSVLLDAGSGPGWRYRDAATGIEANRSEGLALASGEDGMDFTRALFAAIRAEPDRYMSPEAVLILEIGNERPHFERAFPDLPVFWLPTSSGDDQVLLVTKEALQ